MEKNGGTEGERRLCLMCRGRDVDWFGVYMEKGEREGLRLDDIFMIVNVGCVRNQVLERLGKPSTHSRLFNPGGVLPISTQDPFCVLLAKAR